MENALTQWFEVEPKSNIHNLEYFDKYKMKKEKRELIETMLQSDNRYDVEFATIYDIDDHYTSKRISNVQALNAFSDIKPSNHEVEIGIKIFKSYIYAEEQAFGLLDEYTMGLEYAIDFISDEYIREMYKIRCSMITITSLVAKDYIKEVRQVCEKIMSDNLDNYYSALVALQYGNSFMLDNPDKAIEIYREGLSLANSSRCDVVRGNLQNSYDFVNIMIGNAPSYLNVKSTSPSDIHNIAYSYIKKGQASVGEMLLNTIDFASLNDVQKAFHHYYRGFIGEPIKHFSQSLKHFKLGGEYYFRKLALYELERLRLDRNVIEALSV